MSEWKNIRGAGSYRQINATTCELRYRKDGKQLIRRVLCTPVEAQTFLADEFVGRRKRKAGMIGGSVAQAQAMFRERQLARGKSLGYVEAVESEVMDLMEYHESLEAVSADGVEKFLLSEKCSNATRNKKRAMLRSFFHFCCRKRFVSANPIDGVERFEVVKKEPRRLLPGEFQSIKNQFGIAEVYANAFDWLLLTGCRVGEMIAAEWGDFHNSRWVVGKRKRGVNVTIPLNNTLQDILMRQNEIYQANIEGDGIRSTRGPFSMLTKKQILFAIAKACKLAGVPRIKTHDLRHAAASWAIEGGATHEQVKHLLGHTSSKTTEIYSNPDPVDTARAVQGLIEKKLKGE